MKEITLDCTAIQTRRQMHEALANALDFSEWYGNNLDALHDCLTSITAETKLTLANFVSMGTLGAGFQHVLLDAAQENRHFHVDIA